MRAQALEDWLKENHFEVKTWCPIPGDASFRRYFRFTSGAESYIAVDSPPEQEPCEGFVAIAKAFKNTGLTVPEVLAHDTAQGFMCLSDLGDCQFQSILTPDLANDLFERAFDQLAILQQCRNVPNWPLPHFDDHFMREELKNFQYWMLEKHCGIKGDSHGSLLQKTFDYLIKAALEQPQVCMHRDYHASNLMILPGNQVGILDFQDACVGPVTYDVISLLRDRYIDWPRDKINQWALSYHARLLEQKTSQASQEQFLYWLDLMGMQRHLKMMFIFARKFHRDNNDRYLQYLPRMMRYITTICADHPPLQAFSQFLLDACAKI